MDDQITAILNNIEESNSVLEMAWKNRAPQVSQKLKILGKTVGDRSLRKQFEESKDVSRSNVLERFKYFWGGSYLTRLRSGEIIFADLSYFRSLFLPSSVHSISIEQSFFRINELWFQAQKAFFARENILFTKLLTEITTEIFHLRRLMSIHERQKEGRNTSKVRALISRIFAKFSKE